MEQNNNQNGESKIRKVLFNEISFVIAIVGAVAGLLMWIINPQRTTELEIQRLGQQQELTEKIQNIKDNDLHTLQLRIEDIDAKVIQTNQNVLRLETILDERLPAKKD